MNAPDRVYLDWNASAPLRPEARTALMDALDRFGNPSSVHAHGRDARNLVDAARDTVAAFMGCEPGEVVFTSGGTEANNLAVHALAAAAGARAAAVAGVEHPSVLEPVRALERAGWRISILPVAADGRVAADGLPPGTGFAALQAANHETGARQPVAAFADACAAAGVGWHCDAVQAWGRLALRAPDLGSATASLSGHKLGAPKGVGALYVRRDTPVEPLLRGGPQERNRRAGTENVPGIAALAAACAAAAEDREADARWTAGLVAQLVAGARQAVPHLQVNGPPDPGDRLPNTVNLSVPGIPAETVVQVLDLEGISISAGAACGSGAVEASPVLTAMGLPHWRLQSAFRVSVGPTTRPEDVDRFLAALGRVAARLG